MTSALIAITFDCADAARLAAFWATVLDQPVDADPSADFASIGMVSVTNRPGWMFIQVPEGVTAKNRCHPDLETSDLAVETARLIAAGASAAGTFTEGGHHWTTFTDPEGNVFDVVQR